MPEENTSIPSPVPPLPQAPAPQKGKTWKTVLTIVFLVLFWPIGLILIWTIAPWRRKIKIIVTLAFVAVTLVLLIGGILLSSFLFELLGRNEVVNDAYIKGKMVQIRAAAELHYFQEESYSGANCLHPEISPFCNDIKERMDEEPTIHVAPGAYCLYIKLVSGEYFCIDGGPLIYEGSVNPGEAGYCDGQTFVCPN